MQTIVVGFDGSEPANHALERATGLVDDGGKVILVSAIHMLAGKGGMGFDPIEKETSTSSSIRRRLVSPMQASQPRPFRAWAIRPGSSRSRRRR